MSETERSIEILNSLDRCAFPDDSILELFPTLDRDGVIRALESTKSLAITALRSLSEVERVKEASANRLTQRNNMGMAVLIQEFMCDRCNEGFWGLGEITDRLAYFEENKSEAERKIEKIREYCKTGMHCTSFPELSARHMMREDILEILEGKTDES